MCIRDRQVPEGISVPCHRVVNASGRLVPGWTEQKPVSYTHLFELPVEGTNEKKWVLLCSLGDGPFGDSATQYFVGTFNGKEFVNESPSKTCLLYTSRCV